MTTQRLTAIVATVFFLAHCYGYFGRAVAAAAVVGVAWLVRDGWQNALEAMTAERRRIDDLKARADIQDAQVANGDPREPTVTPDAADTAGVEPAETSL